MSDHNWPSGSHRIFISYAREDASFLALQLRNDLNNAGQDTWLDTAEIGAGGAWAQDIEEAIENCDIFIALLSYASYISPTCRAEQSRAMRKNKRIIPILVQQDADRPLEFETFSYIDFSNNTHYESSFADLATAITVGFISNAPTPSPSAFLPPKQSTGQMKAVDVSLKRDANGFRRYLNDLRGEPWLGERHWWTYFLFAYYDLHDVIDILNQGEIAPKHTRIQHGNWDHTIRLNFRPRTPDLFGCEGIRPTAEQPQNHCPMPVYLLFDIESVITLADVRFSEGDISQRPRTYSTASAFRDLPFHQIYHDTWFRPDERDEILNARRAQVIVPHTLNLSHLRHIWCRSSAEYETLFWGLPDAVRSQWGERITVRKDYNLFHSKWHYVEQVTLGNEGALFQFNPCGSGNYDECAPFDVLVQIRAWNDPETVHEIAFDNIELEEQLGLDFDGLALSGGYDITLYLDDVKAYSGRYIPERN